METDELQKKIKELLDINGDLQVSPELSVLCSVISVFS